MEADGTVSDCKLEGASETESIGGAALEELAKQVVAANSAEIDGVSGATHHHQRREGRCFCRSGWLIYIRILLNSKKFGQTLVCPIFLFGEKAFPSGWSPHAG